MGTRNKNRAALTVAEAMIAMVILAMATAGVILPFSGGAAVRIEGTDRTVAAMLASDMLEKIIAGDYDGIIDTYDGYTETEGAMTDIDGRVFDDDAYGGFSRAVCCRQVAGMELIWVTVNVYKDSREMIKVSTLVGNNG